MEAHRVTVIRGKKPPIYGNTGVGRGSGGVGGTLDGGGFWMCVGNFRTETKRGPRQKCLGFAKDRELTEDPEGQPKI